MLGKLKEIIHVGTLPTAWPLVGVQCELTSPPSVSSSSLSLSSTSDCEILTAPFQKPLRVGWSDQTRGFNVISAVTPPLFKGQTSPGDQCFSKRLGNLVKCPDSDSLGLTWGLRLWCPCCWSTDHTLSSKAQNIWDKVFLFGSKEEVDGELRVGPEFSRANIYQNVFKVCGKQKSKMSSTEACPWIIPSP